MRLTGILFTIIIGTLFSLTAVSSIIVLGWLMKVMHTRTKLILGKPLSKDMHPSWILGTYGDAALYRLLGGLISNIRLGINASISLMIATFPYAVFWLVAWWAGWENSFNKGYEQAYVGPLVGTLGIVVFSVFMIYIPMALVHQAVEGRAFSFFEMRCVRNIVAHTGWGYIIWAFSTVFLALPIFASRGLPVFAEGIYPDVVNMTAEEVVVLKGNIKLLVAAYIFITLIFLKRWVAKIYAKAVLKAGNAVSVNSDTSSKYSHPKRFGRAIRFILLFIIWTSLAILIFVGQFLNHEWHVWLTHPYVFLPWVM